MDYIDGRRVLGSTRLIRRLLGALPASRPAKLCYLLMAAYGRDSGECYVSISTLASDLQASVPQVRRYLRELTRAALIAPEESPGRPTRYRLLWHPIFAPDPTPPLSSMTGVPLSSMTGAPIIHDRGCIGIMYRNIDSNRRRGTLQQNPPAQKSPAPAQSTTTTLELLRAIKAELHAYMQGGRKTWVAPPDPAIVSRCARAMRGHTIEELRAVLTERFHSGYRPGTPEGPRNYAWFLSVIRNAFADAP